MAVHGSEDPEQEQLMVLCRHPAAPMTDPSGTGAGSACVDYSMWAGLVIITKSLILSLKFIYASTTWAVEMLVNVKRI